MDKEKEKPFSKAAGEQELEVLKLPLYSGLGEVHKQPFAALESRKVERVPLVRLKVVFNFFKKLATFPE